MTTARAHHFVPRVLLKGFADEDLRVWVWRLRTQRWVPQHIDQVAHQRDFYRADGEAEASVEKWFDREIDLDVVLHDPRTVRDAVVAAGLEAVEWYLRGPITTRGETTERLYVLARRPPAAQMS